MSTRDPLTEVFAALAHPTRRDILDRLTVEPLNVGELASRYDVSAPAISQHLKVLERSGLIERAVHQQWRTCSLSEDGLDDAAEWIARHRADWTERFDLLDERIRSKRNGPPMNSFTIERRFDASPDELWEAWTDPDEATHWWHPHGVHTPRETVQIDARVGGHYSYTMVHDETGKTYPTAGVYRRSILLADWCSPGAPRTITPTYVR